MSGKQVILAGAAALVVAVFFVFFKKESTMPETFLKSSEEMADFVPFDEDIAAIEQAWSTPIPPELHLIGGVDEIGYALAWRNDDDPPNIFQGHFMNSRVRYIGPLRYEHPSDNPLPDIKAGNYVISYIENEQLLVGQDTTTPPRDWFYLVPTQPQNIEYAP